MANLSVKDALCRMAEYDLFRNMDTGGEYTGFKGLYCDGMMENNHVSTQGYAYDITEYDKSHHLLIFFKNLIDEETQPEMIMTSGSFFSMNKKLQKAMAKQLMMAAAKGSVILYVGEKNIPKLFKGSDVQVKVFDRKTQFIIHFIKTKNRFIFVMPHNEKKLVRVDIKSDTFNPQAAKRILDYFDNLVKELDEAIEKNNRMDNNAQIKKHR